MDAPKLRWMDGRAMFTIVTSTPTMNRLRQQVARMMSGRRAGANVVVLIH